MTEPGTLGEIRKAVEELAALDYPRVWIGEEGMTPDEYLSMEEWNKEDRREAWEGATAQDRREVFDEMPEDLRERVPEELFEEPPAKWDELPEWLREQMRGPLEVEPGEFVGIEGGEGGIQIPKIGHEYLDGLWVILNMPDVLSDQARVELEREVSHIRAAKQGAVLTIRDSPERMAPDVWPVPVERLTDDDLSHVRLDEMRFYAEDTMGPYVVEDSERTRAALEQRLGSGRSDEERG